MTKPAVKIDFYILAEKAQNQESVSAKRNNLWTACLLCEKAYLSGLSVFILTRDENQSKQINALLWKFKQNAFIPHSLDLASDDIVLISSQFEKSKAINSQVVINLSHHFIEANHKAAQVERILEIVEHSDKVEARKKYKHYQSLKLKLDAHQL